MNSKTQQITSLFPQVAVSTASQALDSLPSTDTLTKLQLQPSIQLLKLAGLSHAQAQQAICRALWNHSYQEAIALGKIVVNTAPYYNLAQLEVVRNRLNFIVMKDLGYGMLICCLKFSVNNVPGLGRVGGTEITIYQDFFNLTAPQQVRVLVFFLSNVLICADNARNRLLLQFGEKFHPQLYDYAQQFYINSVLNQHDWCQTTDIEGLGHNHSKNIFNTKSNGIQRVLLTDFTSVDKIYEQLQRVVTVGPCTDGVLNIIAPSVVQVPVFCTSTVVINSSSQALVQACHSISRRSLMVNMIGVHRSYFRPLTSVNTQDQLRELLPDMFSTFPTIEQLRGNHFVLSALTPLQRVGFISQLVPQVTNAEDCCILAKIGNDYLDTSPNHPFRENLHRFLMELLFERGHGLRILATLVKEPEIVKFMARLKRSVQMN